MAPQFSTQIGGSMTFTASLSASMNTTANVTTSRNYRPLVMEPSTPVNLNGPPPPLILSVEEADSLDHLADSVLNQTLSDYLHFRDVRKRRLHDEQWKEVRRQNNLVAFKERESWRQQHQTLCTPDGRLEPVVCKTSVPTLLVLGALQGTLDDEMYGMHFDSDDAVKLRSSYIHDQVHDFRILTRIRGATKDDPFRFCGVTWSDLGNTGYGPFARKRDYCAVTSMGVTKTPRGERVGYYVVHSVDVSSNGPMGRTTQLGLAVNGNGTASDARKYTRAKGSMCWLKCELPNGGVELYMQGFFAPMGSVPEFAVVNAALNAALGLAQTSDTSYSKKIRWMLHDSVRSTRRLLSPTTEDCVGRCKSHFGVTKKRKFGCCIVCRADESQSDGGCGSRQRRAADTLLHLLFVHGVRETNQRHGVCRQRNGSCTSSKQSSAQHGDVRVHSMRANGPTRTKSDHAEFSGANYQETCTSDEGRCRLHVRTRNLVKGVLFGRCRQRPRMWRICSKEGRTLLKNSVVGVDEASKLVDLDRIVEGEAKRR